MTLCELVIIFLNSINQLVSANYTKHV